MELVHLKYGYVCEVRPGKVRVDLADENISSYWLPVLRRKVKTDLESWPLEVNEHVACLFDEHCNTGICLGAIHSEKDPPDSGEAVGKFRKKFSDGTIIEYDKGSGTLIADVKGKIVAKTTGDVEIQAGQNLKGIATIKAIIQAPNLELTGEVKITGAVTINGAVNVVGALSAASISTSGGGNIQASGNIQVDGNLTVTGSVKGNGVDLKNHIHTNGNNGANTGTAI